MKSERPFRLIAIVGGSGAGKTWLANRLQQAAGHEAGRLSLDDFYRDRSNLAPVRRSAINFDHPRAIDWPLLLRVLRDCRAGRMTRLPRYNFVSHTRRHDPDAWLPSASILVEGLWLFLRPAVREMFDLKIFLACATPLRLERRLARDVAERGRTADAVREQFWKTVAPMHERFVAPQARWADIILTEPPSEKEIQRLVDLVHHPEPARDVSGPKAEQPADRACVCPRANGRFAATRRPPAMWEGITAEPGTKGF